MRQDSQWLVSWLKNVVPRVSVCQSVYHPFPGNKTSLVVEWNKASKEKRSLLLTPFSCPGALWSSPAGLRKTIGFAFAHSHHECFDLWRFVFTALYPRTHSQHATHTSMHQYIPQRPSASFPSSVHPHYSSLFLPLQIFISFHFFFFFYKTKCLIEIYIENENI